MPSLERRPALTGRQVLFRVIVGLIVVAGAVVLTFTVHPFWGIAVGIAGWTLIGSALTSGMDNLPPGAGGPPFAA